MLALDTATAGVVVGLARRAAAGWTVLAAQQKAGPPRHAETLAPAIAAVLAAVGCDPGDLDAVVVGTGPGPFTGLRVGVATAAALGDALGVPVHGVCSLDAVALRGTGPAVRTLVATDARRRELYWALYEDGERIEGPHVDLPAVLSARWAELAPEVVLGDGAQMYGLPAARGGGPEVPGLLAAAAPLLDHPARPLVADYLRRPDATAPAPRVPGGRAPRGVA